MARFFYGDAMDGEPVEILNLSYEERKRVEKSYQKLIQMLNHDYQSVCARHGE